MHDLKHDATLDHMHAEPDETLLSGPNEFLGLIRLGRGPCGLTVVVRTHGSQLSPRRGVANPALGARRHGSSITGHGRLFLLDFQEHDRTHDHEYRE